MAETSKHPILVVDDEPEILHSLRGLLRMEFDVHTATGGAEAMRVLQEQPIHVVMADQRMPEMTGIELLSRVQGRWPDAIRMVFTGYSDVKAVIDAINEGHVFRYITKPWDPEELRAVLHQACEEYVRIVARKELLSDLRQQQERVVALTEQVRSGSLGMVTTEGQAQVEQVAAEARALAERLERALASG